MDTESAIAEIARLTGSLQASGEASAADLRLARRSLAIALLQDQAGNITPLPPPAELPAPDQVEPLSNSLRAELTQIVADAQTASERLQVFRREMPVVTHQSAGSVPAWASGRAVERSLGPFFDSLGRPYWFDVYGRALFLRVVRVPGGGLLLLIPPSSTIADDTTIQLASGSVWIGATQFGAPDGFIGLRISGGTLTLSAPGQFTPIGFIIPDNAIATLTIQLDTATEPGPSAGPGLDAAAAQAGLPASAVFVFAPAGIDAVNPSTASITAYGSRLDLSPKGGLPVFDSQSGLVLVLFEPAVADFRIVESQSALFHPGGDAPVTGAAWALPVARIDAQSLGEAASAGALSVQLGAGIAASWQGAGQSAKLADATISVDSTQLMVRSSAAVNRRSKQVFALWQESGSRHPSTVEVAFEKPFPLLHVSSRDGIEVLILAGVGSAQLDRPIQADGGNQQFRGAVTNLLLTEDSAGRSVSLSSFLPRQVSILLFPPKLIALALSNALLVTSEPQSLTLAGALESGSRVPNGTVSITSRLFSIVPILPDPYAANFGPPPERSSNPTAPLPATLIAKVTWPDPARPNLALLTVPSPEAPESPLVSLLPPAPPPAGVETETDQQFREIFEATIGAGREQLRLLDVSSNADQFGVGFGVPSSGPGSTSDLGIAGMDLVSGANNLRVFTLPEIQWEPVSTVQNPDLKPFPSPLASSSDGGPTLIGVRSVHLVPIAPEPMLRQIVTDFSENRRPAATVFTLPFGMKAVAALASTSISVPTVAEGGLMDLNQPRFTTPALVGGLQLSLTATAGAGETGGESPFLPGMALQTPNGVDSITGVPLFLSVLSDNNTNEVVDHFNKEFGPSGTRPRVPVTRIDFSGYGASLFSNWTNPNADIALTSQVRFDVIVGRTAYEVVQVRSILYPWGVRVVRTVTIRRTGGGGVFRRDSGWVAVSDGVFDFRYRKPDDPGKGQVVDPGIVTHPGVVRGIFGVRHIRDTPQIFTSPDKGAKLAAVYFDGDVDISGVIRGQGAEGRVPTQGQLGFVQLDPKGVALTPRQYRELIEQQGALGGPVDCVIDVGGSGQHMRIVRVDISNGGAAGGTPVFVGAARGSLLLPKDADWTITRGKSDGSEPQAVDPHAGMPLIREGPATVVDPLNFNPYRFADPSDLLADEPQTDYGLMQSCPAQRILFPRPKIERDQAAITSTLNPLLADSYTLISSAGLFPKTALAIPIPAADYSLDVIGEGQLRLRLPFPNNTFTVAVPVKELVKTAQMRVYADYSDGGGKQTAVTISIDSTASPAWLVRMSPVSVVLDLDPFAGLMRVVSTSISQQGVPPKLSESSIVYGSVLSPVQAVISVLKDFGLPLPLALSLSNSGPENRTYKLKAGMTFDLSKAKEIRDLIQIGVGKLDLELKVGFELNTPRSLLTENVFRSDQADGRLYLELSGAYQAPIIKPIFYAGGFFKFEISAGLKETKLKLAAGVVGSVGQEDLIPKLVDLEASVKHGLLLVIEGGTVRPGDIIGIEAKAKLLSGMIGITFKVEAEATMTRLDPDTVGVSAKITIAAEITLAIFFETDIEIETEYKQELPMVAVAGLLVALGVAPVL